jgi:NAD(P)-dependent dehydrogenase (short-subunit alcohol dehydrogenase family)
MLYLGASTELADALGADARLRPPGSTEELAAWRAEIEAQADDDAVVVCTWTDPGPAVPLADLDPDAWRARVEWPTALWFTTLVAAAGRCRDGGAIVVVVERPATLDAPGHAAEVAVGDGLLNLVRSLALIEGARGIRVNAVTTRLHTVPPVLLGAAPALATFPGRVDVEVAGAVRLLLSPDAAGITGEAIAADGGRS